MTLQPMPSELPFILEKIYFIFLSVNVRVGRNIQSNVPETFHRRTIYVFAFKARAIARFRPQIT
jgi:hypothetical protein